MMDYVVEGEIDANLCNLVGLVDLPQQTFLTKWFTYGMRDRYIGFLCQSCNVRIYQSV